MSRLLVAVLVSCLFVGCHRAPSSQVSSPTASPLTERPSLDDLVVGTPFCHANLAVFPISSKEPKTEDRLMTLDEGLEAGTIEVLEAGAHQSHAGHGNSVGQVLVVNRSEKPLYLMPGEIILGGDQDRCIGEELVVQPGEEPVPIKVFCVEHGRWGGRSHGLTAAYVGAASSHVANADSVSVSANLQADLSQAGKEANRGKFIATVGNVNKVARLAVQDAGDQQEVWKEVASVNAQSGIKTNTGDFTSNYIDADNVKRLEPYIEGIRHQVAESDNVVGVIVAINGKVQTMDIFESTPLFTKLWPKLLKSYSLDAANVAQGDGVNDVCSRESAREFLADAMQGEVQESDVQDGVARVKRVTDRVVAFSASETAAGAPAEFDQVRYDRYQEQSLDAHASKMEAGATASPASSGVHTSAFSK